MADGTGIQWTDATWQVTRGCSVVSPGCKRCYAMRMAARLERMGRPEYAGLTQPTASGPVFTGRVDEADLGETPQPLRWRKPRRVFVNSMSDLFHDGVSSDHIAHVFGIMACAPRHTFQVLTKRPSRANWLLNDTAFWLEVAYWAKATATAHAPSATPPLPWGEGWGEGLAQALPNVWLGVSVEDQRRANERIPYLQTTSAAVRFLAVEPLLDSVVLDLRGIGWVIVGGESGPGARPMDPAWARAVIDDCRAEGVPVFMKQFGSAPGSPFGKGKRDDPDAWPDWACVREFPA